MVCSQPQSRSPHCPTKVGTVLSFVCVCVSVGGQRGRKGRWGNEHPLGKCKVTLHMPCIPRHSVPGAPPRNLALGNSWNNSHCFSYSKPETPHQHYIWRGPLLGVNQTAAWTKTDLETTERTQDPLPTTAQIHSSYFINLTINSQYFM